MKNEKLKINKLLLGIILIVPFVLMFIQPVKAQLTGCDFLPCEATNEGDDADADKADKRLEDNFNFAASLIFMVLIGLGIVKIIIAAITIIRSESNAEKFTQGANTLKGVWTGVIILFIGIIGLVVVTIILGYTGIFEVQVEDPEGLDVPIVNTN